MRARPVWLAGGVLAASFCASLGRDLPPIVVLALAGVTCILAGLRLATWRQWAAAALGAAIIVARLLLVPAQAAPGAVPLPQGAGTWKGVVEAATRSASGGQSTVLRLTNPAVECFASLPGYSPVPVGSTVTFSGRVAAPPPSDFGRYVTARGIPAICEVTSITVEAGPTGPGSVVEAARQASGDALARAIPEPEAGLASGILVGLRDRVDRAVATSFTTAGVSHIVAISGWNIAIVAGVVSALFGSLGRRRRSALTLAAVAAYTLFAGASPSVIRAAAMAAVVLLAAEAGGRARAPVALAWAVVAMLVVEPSTALDVGFQLSSAATAGLMVWSRPCTRLLETRMPWLPAAIRESMGVSLAAQVATLPIVLLTFGRLALVSPLVNLAAAPLVPIAMATGVVALVAGLAIQVGVPAVLLSPLTIPAWLSLWLLIAVVDAGAAMPGASLTLAPPLNWVGAAAAFAVVISIASRRRQSQAATASAPRLRPESRPSARRPDLRRLAAFLAALAVAGCVFVTQPDGAVHVTVFDVGQGDAILVEGDAGSRVLVDGGPDPERIADLLDSRLPPWSRTLDAVVLTHPHDDHVGGLAAVMRRLEVRRAFESNVSARTPAYTAWKEATQRRGLTSERLVAGGRLRVDDVTLDVLWPPAEPIACGSGSPTPGCGAGTSANRATNDASIVLLGSFKGRHFLLTGDAEDDVDPALVAAGLPHLDLLKVAHHGSGTATSSELLDPTRPGLAVISVGKDNDYGHPNAGTIRRLEQAGSRVVRTDRSGTIEAVLTAESVRLITDGSGAGPGSPGAAFAAAGPGGGTTGYAGDPLLYDSGDVDPEPFRERPAAAFPRPARVAPPSLACRRGGRRLARPRVRRPEAPRQPAARRSGRAPP